MDIMPLEKIVDKWNRRVGIAGPEFEDGLRNPKVDWETATLAAVSAWEAAMQEAIRLGTWAKGIREAGTRKWQDRSLTLGVARWPSGVAAAVGDYRTGFAPYHAALERLTLPARYARGDVRNYERVKAIGVTLRKIKLGQAA